MAFLGKVAFFFGIFIFLTIHRGNCESTPQSPCSSECTDPVITGNLSDPFVLKSYESDITARVWATGNMVPKTPLVTELRDILLEMSASDSFYFSNFAFGYALWSAALLGDPHVYTNFCPFAKIINDSVAYAQGKNDSLYLQNFYDVSSAVYTACSMRSIAALEQMGCRNLTHIPNFSTTCYDNGLVYCANEAWNQFGRLLPWVLTDVFFRLYESRIFVERAHAAVLAFMVTPASFKLYAEHPPYLIVESMLIFVESSEVSRCCCDCRSSRLNAICLTSNETVFRDSDKEGAENCLK